MLTLVLDQGGHSSRALVFNEYGKCVAKTQHPIKSKICPKTKHVESQPFDILSSLKNCLHDLLQLGLPPIDQAALICQRSNLIACNKLTLQPITPIISWQDVRHANYLEQQINDNSLNIEQFHSVTGLRPNAHLGLSKIQWLLRFDASVRYHHDNHTLIFMPASAWLSAQLCYRPLDNIICDPSCAQRLGLLNIHTGQWSQALLKAAGIDATCLPELVDSCYEWGHLLGAIPLNLVGGDQSFIPYIAEETTRQNSFFVNLGSGAFILSDAEKNILNNRRSSQLYSVSQLSAQEGVFLEATVNSAANAINTYYNAYMKVSYSTLADAIEQAVNTQHAKIPLYLNASNGLAAPFWDARLRSMFCYPAPPSKAALLEFKAVIESVIFLITINLEIFNSVKPLKSQIIVSGGLSQSGAMMQLLADVTGLLVLVSAETEASSKGAANVLLITHNTLEYKGAYRPQENQSAFCLKQRLKQFKQLMIKYTTPTSNNV